MKVEQQSINRKTDSIKVLTKMQERLVKEWEDNPTDDLNEEFGRSLKHMAIDEAIKALHESLQDFSDINRLAEIGRATEKMFKLRNPDIAGFTGTIYLCFLSIKELLEWFDSEGKAGEGE